MRRPLPNFVAVCLLILSLVTPRPADRTPPPIVTPTATPEADWTPLRVKLDEQAYVAAVRATQARPRSSLRVSRNTGSQRVVYGSGACGGDLPPCSVMECESHGNLAAQNPRSSASGKWQILDSTWAGYEGYESASDAPEEVQDARAREIYANGAGRSAWVC